MSKGGFRGGYPGGNQMNMMKQAQKMQQDLLKMQQELESKSFEFSAGGGVVKATVGGNKKLESIVIDPEAVDPDDVEMLQDMIIAAVNEATRAADNEAATAEFALSSRRTKLSSGCSSWNMAKSSSSSSSMLTISRCTGAGSG